MCIRGDLRKMKMIIHAMNRQGVMVRRDLDVTEVVEGAMDRVSWCGETWR